MEKNHKDTKNSNFIGAANEREKGNNIASQNTASLSPPSFLAGNNSSGLVQKKENTDGSSEFASLEGQSIVAPPPFSVTNSGASPVQKKEKNKTGMMDGVKNKMEKSFGTDFSDVNIHTNSNSAEGLGAQAYTQGTDIHFASGKFDQNSIQGQELLGHELSHVVQQKQGRVSATHQENGFNINDANSLESEADSHGRIAANGGSINAGPVQKKSNPGQQIQKKNAPIQMSRLLPSGAPIFLLNLSGVDSIISSFSSLWSSFNGFGWLNSEFADHESLADSVRTVCGGNYFRGANFWSSEWVDDGGNDWWNLGVLDNDVRITMQLYVDNETVGTTGQGTFNSGGSTSVADTHSQTQTLTGNGGVSAGGHEGAPGAELGGSASVSNTNSRTMNVTGTNGLSMASSAQQISGKIKMKLGLKVNPTGMSIKRKEAWTGEVGTIMFGNPTP